MVKEDKATWKSNYFMKMAELLATHTKVYVVTVDNVGSRQMQNIRAAMRDSATILCGKNTMMRKTIRGNLDKVPGAEKLLPLLKNNVALVFVKEDLTLVRNQIKDNRVPAAARAGALAPVSCSVPAQVTALGPEKTSFFQALTIPTKITRGNIEILSEVQLIEAGSRVGASEATLLSMLGITPFTYGMEITSVYDNGSVYSPAILDITSEDLRATFMMGVRNVAALSLEINYPTACSAPHSIVNGFKNCLAIAAETDISFPEAETMKAYLADPSAFAAAAPVAAKTETAAAAAPAQEEEEESDDDMGFGLFD